MNLPLYKGNCDNQIQPEGVKTCADTVTRSVVIKGKKTTLATLQDATYANGNTFDTTWVILSTELRDLPGYMAKLTISLAAKGTSTESYPNPISVVDLWEINWVQLEKPLLANPKSKLFAQYAGENGDLHEPYRQEIIDEVSAWRDSPQQRKRKYQIPLVSLTREPVANADADWQDVGASALKICKKIAAGTEAYLTFYPVITKKAVYSEKPNTGGCGIITLSPAVEVVNYKYLKTGDQAIQQQDKTWQRTESWQGADTWDTDLYPSDNNGLLTTT